MDPPVPPFDPVTMVADHGQALVNRAAGADLDAPITSCPGWTVADLGVHVLECWSFWEQVVTRGAVERRDLDAIDAPTEVSGAAFHAALRAVLDALVEALSDAPADQPVWSWAGPGLTVEWLRRRMVHEAVVHRWDLASSLGDPFEVPVAIAADGIDEFLAFFAAHQRAAGSADLDGSVHLHCTDTSAGDVAGGEWFVEALTAGTCSCTREHRRGDVAVRGRAHDLLLWLWGRAGTRPEVLEFLGDAAVADRFVGFGDLDF